ncbi:MAG: sugar ABC transporter permease, partial [Oscillospiraceae bacterium]
MAEGIAQKKEKVAKRPRKSSMERKSTWALFLSQWQLYLILLPGLLFYVIFNYVPMGGLVIAFKDYGLWTGVMGSPWVGLKHFDKFFSSPDFWLLFKNTLTLGLFTLIFSFPFPIILALLLN